MGKFLIVLLILVSMFSLYKSVKALVVDIKKIKVRRKVHKILFADESVQGDNNERAASEKQ